MRVICLSPPGWLSRLLTDHSAVALGLAFVLCLGLHAEHSGAQEVHEDSNESELRPDEEQTDQGDLRAFRLPGRERAEVAIRGIWIIGAIAAGGLILFFILWIVYYSPPSWMEPPSKPTEVVRKKGFKPTPRKHLSDKKRKRIDLD